METSGAPEKQVSDEAQLLREGRQLVGRAVRLSTETHKIKVWVPLLCSMILTAYYLCGLHRKNTTSMDLSQPVAPQAAVVPEASAPAETPTQMPTSTQPKATAEPEDVSSPSATAAPSSPLGDSPADIRKRAEQAHGAGQFVDEAKLWQQFMDHSPVPQEACPAIGKAYERVGEIDSSIQAFEKCVSYEPGNVDTLVSFAHVLQTKRDFTRAGSLYRQVLSKDPKNMDAQTGMALLDLKQNHLHEADERVKNILGKAPNNADALLISGIVAWRESRLADAEGIFLRGTGLDDQRADFHAFLGRIAEAQRHPQEALRQYDRALALDPSDGDVAERRERLQGTR